MTGVLVVDDSSFARLSIIKQLSKDPEIEIIGYAKDGIEAIEKVKELKPDVVTLDIQMPRMNGLEALEHIMTEEPTPVIMLSSITEEGSAITLRSLELGAIDFFLKQSAASPASISGTDETLVNKIKYAAIAGKKLKNRERTLHGRVPSTSTPVSGKSDIRNELTEKSRVVVIASSTGGPGALYELIPHISSEVEAAVLIVQHMPPGFTKSLSERLNELSPLSVKEAEHGDLLYEGRVFIAPGNYHMITESNNRITLNQQPPVMFLRPSANLTMKSVAKIYGSRAIGIVLTGMGADGTDGAKEIKSCGGKIAVQDESTSVIFSMPENVINAGIADMVLPLDKMADVINKMCTQSGT
ncbi:MAG: chemotaxis response regulator protein-glutamate methylesterase [Dehalococcoidales bacterium]|nr:chemotaxis response regulator protein-glutamate methylesterase [Dehalococcoidales bacterium]